MAKKLVLIIFVILTIAISYLLYKPLPSEIEEPWAARGYIFFIEYSVNLARFGEFLGLGNWGELTRGIMGFMVSHFFSPTVPDSVTITDTVFDGVAVRIYHPSAAKNKLNGAIVYYHGGGWVWGNTDIYQPLTLALATRTGAPVVSVDYRQSPEFIYPVHLDDCVTATIHFIEHAKDFNVDPKRIVIAGDSAGGNIAAAVALRLNSMKFPILPLAQVLIYPALHLFDLSLPSILDNDLFLTRTLRSYHQLAYLGLGPELVEPVIANNHTTAATKAKYANVFDVNLLPEKYRSSDYRKSVHEGIPEVVELVQEKILDPFFAPLMAPAELVRGLPSAYIITCGLDSLRDEGYFYANKLRQHGVGVEHVDYPTAWHPFVMQVDSPFDTRLTNQAVDHMVEYIKEKLKA